MSEQQQGDQFGLPWPKDYRELRPLIQEKWGVAEEIYLHHKLSGKSGALVYAADISSREFSGQAILKLDRLPDPEWQETSEADRHQRAVERAPAYAAAHLPKILHTLHHGGGSLDHRRSRVGVCQAMGRMHARRPIEDRP